MSLALALALDIGHTTRPSDFSGLVLWLPAYTITVADGSALATWPDNSGAGHSASNGTPSQRPTFHARGGQNGKPYVAYAAASSQNLACSSAVANANSFTIFSVQQYTSIASNIVALSLSNAHNSAVLASGPRRDNSVNPGVSDDLDQTSLATTSWEKWTTTGSSVPAQTMRVNGVAHTLSPNNSTAGTTSGVTTIGANGALTVFFQGNIAEIIVYNRVLSANEIAQVEAYLAALYAL